MYDIKNLMIWKEDQRGNTPLTRLVTFVTNASVREVLMDKSNGGYTKVKTIIDDAGLADKLKNPDAKFRFPVYINEGLNNTDLDALELSVRSNNCLKRAGYHSVGDLVEQVNGSDDLKKIRNCGKKSVDEIMANLLCYQYAALSAERRKQYLMRIVELNS